MEQKVGDQNSVSDNLFDFYVYYIFITNNSYILCFSERYRLQCDTFEGLWYVTKELANRLNNHYNRGKTGGFSIFFSGQLPLQDFFEILENHYEVLYLSQRYGPRLEKTCLRGF